MISRKKLYAAGETLGECSTRAKLGGGYVCGGGGGGGTSESSSSSSTSISNTDRRQVLDGGAIGISGDRNSLGISNTDARSFTDSRQTSTNLQAWDNRVSNTIDSRQFNNTDSRQFNNTDSRQTSTNLQAWDNRTSNTTDSRQFSNTDSRVTNTSINTIDSDSIEAGKAISLAGIADNGKNVNHLLSASEKLFGQVGRNLQKSTDLTAILSAGNNDALKANIGLTSLLAENAQKDLAQNYSLVAELAKSTKNAYGDATAQATGNKQILMVGLAVIGIAAVTIFGKK